ncbi:MAG: glutamate-1-semialdehyde 2,1-aminomutase [Candidatus Thermoplasmatota archaeon]|jgi:glutamate-1-semialdehyde 2,1-aminomutase|nr:glutamate-1-semialdehyde 2,1-aminomutase [Candidatus Thermoplasmatota archaeon]MCL5984850.1 glutamate-1-semialdehyde 2,1-aminomutase [Candidatus Thermoplasmatota archaeon]
MERSPRSARLSAEARKYLPGGVSSPVRAYPPYPRYIARGKGAYLFDVDGRRYVDHTLAFGPLLLGHASPIVTRAVRDQLARGTIFGAPVEQEVTVARLLCRMFPSLEMLRFVSTGGEAALSLLRLARAVTGKAGVVKMDGGFHGSVDPLLVKAGSGAAAIPSSEGVASSPSAPTYLLPFNDLEAARELLRSHDDIGLLLLEPVLGNMGTILPEPGYLSGLRSLTREHGVLLAFDEVITGFHAGYGGAQGRYRVRPDLTMLGKVVGGGLPLAVYGGRRDLLSRIAPSGGVYQAGTYSGNPLSLAAAEAVLQWITRPRLARVESQTRELTRALGDAFARRGVAVQIPAVGSMFSPFLSSSPVRNAAEARACDTASYLSLVRQLLNRGVFLPQNPFESLFVSTEHGETEQSRVLRAFEESLLAARVK